MTTPTLPPTTARMVRQLSAPTEEIETSLPPAGGGAAGATPSIGIVANDILTSSDHECVMVQEEGKYPLFYMLEKGKIIRVERDGEGKMTRVANRFIRGTKFQEPTAKDIELFNKARQRHPGITCRKMDYTHPGGPQLVDYYIITL